MLGRSSSPIYDEDEEVAAGVRARKALTGDVEIWRYPRLSARTARDTPTSRAKQISVPENTMRSDQIRSHITVRNRQE
jgi:hypothetical protein